MSSVQAEELFRPILFVFSVRMENPFPPRFRGLCHPSASHFHDPFTAF